MKVECMTCNQIIEEEDLDFLGKRCDRHTEGRHTPHVVKGERPQHCGQLFSKAMGGLIIGKVEWITL